MTKIIILGAFIFGLGFVTGKFLKGFNPILMIIGLFFAATMSIGVVQESEVYQVLFVIGFLSNWANPIKLISTFYSWIEDHWLQYRYKRSLHSEAEKISENLNSQKKEAEEEINRQYAQAEEEIRQAREELEKEKSKFEQSRNRSTAGSTSSLFSESGLDPSHFPDACTILGLSEGKTIKEYKLAYKRLASKYHPDKIEHLPDHIKRLLTHELQFLNTAIETIKDKLK